MSSFSEGERSAEIAANQDTAGARETASGGTTRAGLRGMTYAEGRAALSPCEGGEGTFIHDLFSRVDENKDCGIEKNEIKDHLGRVGIGGGLFGIVHKKVASAFLEQLDTNTDERVTWEEFRSVSQSVMPADIFDEEGQIRLDLVDEVYAELDANLDAGVTRKEIESSALRQMGEDISNRGKKAEVAGKLGIDALDFDKSGDISKEELLNAARQVAQLVDTSNLGRGGDQ